MVKKRIIPCLLLKNERCVKGVNFKNHRDVGHPVTNARIYQSQGADELIFLDIEASANQRCISPDLIEKVTNECFMPFTAGGGVKTINDIEKLLRAGADKVSINAAAVEDPEFILKAAKKFGKQCIVVDISYKLNEKRENEVFTLNGEKQTGLDPKEWAKKVESLGAGEILLTSIDREGTRTGYDTNLIKEIADSVEIPVIASGGAGSLEDLREAINNGHASAVSLGSILHFTDQNVIKSRNYLFTHGVDVRLTDRL